LCPPLPADANAFRDLSEPERVTLLDEVRPRFAPGVPYLPAPKSMGLYVEEPFSLTLDNGHTFTGTMDAIVFVDRAEPTIYDHKSTKVLTYCKTPDELRRDPQVLCYGNRALQLDPSIQRVHFRWVYYRMTGQPWAQPSDLTLDRSYLEAAWKRINVVAGEMLNLWQARIEPLSIAGNKDHCKKYGGCFYYSICQERDPSMTSVVAPASAGSTLFQNLTGSQVAAPGVSPAAGPVDLFGGADGAAPVPVQAPTAAPAPSDIAAAILARLNAATAGQPAVSAPAAAQSVAPIVQAPAPVPTVTTTTGPVSAPVQAPAPVVVPVVPGALTGTVVSAPVAESTKKRGRPKGSKNPPAVAASPSLSWPAATPAAAGAVPVTTEGAAEGLTLYVGCRPTKGATLDAVINTMAELRGVTLDGAIYVPTNVDAGVLAMLEAVADRVVRVA
jgi:hypothetical protein